MYLYRTRKLQVGGKTGPQPFSVPVAKPTNAGVPAGKVRYGTPEYAAAYKAGKVQNPNAIKGPNPTYWGGELGGVTIHGKPREKGVRDFLIQYKNKMIEDHRDDGVLGAIVATPFDAVVSLPQRAITYAATGKAGVPSDSLGFSAESKGNWTDSPASFAKNLSNTLMDAGTDPMSYLGAGIFTKEELVANLLNKGTAKAAIKKAGIESAELSVEKIPERIAHEKVVVGGHAAHPAHPVAHNDEHKTPASRAVVMRYVTPPRAVSTRPTESATVSRRTVAMVTPPTSPTNYGVFGRGGLLYK